MLRRVRIEQQLVRVEAMSFLGPVGAVDAVAVEQAGPRLRQVAVPDLVGALAQLDALQLAPAGRVEEAQLDALGVLREQREVDALRRPRSRRAGRVGPARPR